MVFTVVLIVVGTLGQLSSGVPLEGPTADYTQFFDSRIVGGIEAPEGMAPHMVSLIVGFEWQSFVCGASIIRENYVLTAAHCIVAQWNGELLNTFHGMVGSNIWHKGTVVEFKGYRNHPEYDPWLIKNDVGVLETKRSIEFVAGRVAPIALDFKPVGGGVKCTVTAWGTDRLWGILPELLHYLNLTTISFEECVEQMRNAVAAVGGSAPHIDPISELCTFHSVNHGMCHGDSGSALVDKKTGKQIGMVSWGLPCAVGAPDVFASIFGARHLIWSIIGRDSDH